MGPHDPADATDHRPHPGMTWRTRTLIALALLALSALTLPFLIPLDRYIPGIEKALSAKLREPVTIGSIRLSPFPLPHADVDGIRVGNSDDIKLGRVRLTPDLWTLPAATTVIREIEVESLVLTSKAIERIPEWTAPDAAPAPGQAPPFRVARLQLDRAIVVLDKAQVGPFDARVELDDAGNMREASFATEDGKLKAKVKPDGANYLIDASAKAWTLPAGPAIVFDEITVKGVATADGADFGEISARLYEGTARGKANIKWRKGVQVHGSLDISRMELAHAAPLLSSDTHVSGRLDAKPTFSAAAASAGQLLDALRLETQFDVQHGIVHGVDVEKAATNLIRQGTTGGETRFDRLSGHLVMEAHAFRFTNLSIASGALGVDGDFGISPSKDLSGRIKAQVKVMGVSTSVPLNIGGTVASPLLYPTAATMAGAAIGTSVMGPGLGTAIGAKVGGWADGMFRGKGANRKNK